MLNTARISVFATLVFAFPSIAMADLSSFQAALSAHLSSIERRDVAAFEATLTSDSNLTFVALDGTVITDKGAFIKTIRGWLADPDWTWSLEQLSVTSDTNVGIGVYRVTYQDIDPQRNPYSLNYVLSLIFAKQGAEWRLVHDQNTRIAN